MSGDQKCFDRLLHMRHACKLFDETRRIPQEDLHFILEAGRMAPSSFGMEPWEFWVVQDPKHKERLRPLCWDQPQITSCSDLVVLLSKKGLRSDDAYVRERFKSRGADYARYLEVYGGFIDPRSDEELICWAQKQVYLASGFMMLAAASVGVDSCPIEGFDKEGVTALLEVDTQRLEIAYLLTFGYRAKAQQPRHRRAFDEVVRFLPAKEKA